MSATTLIVSTSEQLHRAIALVRAMRPSFEQPIALTIRAYAPTRTGQQNKLMWARLRDVAIQVDWYGQKLSAENWKDVFTAAIKKQSVVPGLDGGFVVLGARTSQLTIAEMSELTDLSTAFGDERDVVWTPARI